MAHRTLWVSELELAALWELLQEHQDSQSVDTPIVEAIMMECGVVATRAEAFLPSHKRLAVSMGKSDTHIPMKLTNEEYMFLAKFPHLTNELKEIIS